MSANIIGKCIKVGNLSGSVSRFFPSTKEVYASNYCDIGVHADERTGRLVVISAIDNLVKGASGQAVQNMNLLFGLEEDTGLKSIPVYP